MVLHQLRRLRRSRSPGQLPCRNTAWCETSGLFPAAWERIGMLGTIFAALLVLWLLGMVTSYTMGGFIHILLVLAAIVLLIRVIQGRRIAS
jgi:hypothetical protein